MPQAIFVEQQQFRQSHLWIPLVVLFVVVLGVQLYVIRGREQVHAAQWAGLVLSLAVFLSVGLLLYLAKLEVMVEPGVLKFRMYPLQIAFRIIQREEMRSWEATTVRPLRDHGGWGIRYGRNGAAYLVGGDGAVRILLANAEYLVIGSRRPEEFAAALGKAGN